MNWLRASVFALGALVVSVGFFVLPVQAGQSDAIRGWAWSDHAGWISLNCITAGGCASSDYGVDLADTVSGPGYAITGWAWSPHIGWMCFGSTCSSYGLPPGATGNTAPAYLESSGTEVHGWAYIVSLGSAGWVSLNCDNDQDIASTCTTYRVQINRGTGVVTGFAWNNNTNGNGIGWIDFSFATLSSSETICNDGIDNDSDGPIDCADSDCNNQPGPGGGVCGQEIGPLRCQDGYDNDGDGATDCSDQTTCWHIPASGCPDREIPDTENPGSTMCRDSVDNDHDDGAGGYDASPLTGIDCFDTDCAGDSACPQREDVCGAGSPSICCSDNIDNDSDSQLDCADSDCFSACSGQCVPQSAVRCIINDQCPADPVTGLQSCDTARPWLQALYDDVYSRRNIRGAVPPRAGDYNATFCVFTAPGGSITNFVAQPGAGGASGCPSMPASVDYILPSGDNQYTSTLGRIDVTGIKRGAYGAVVRPTSWSDVPSTLGGKVYYFSNGLTISNATTFRNGLLRQSGAGTIVVEGTLRIEQALTYDGGIVSLPRNLASVGFIVVDRRAADGTLLAPARVEIPTTDRVAGNFYTEGTINTATLPAGNLPTLTVSGFMIARQFELNRSKMESGDASERIIFDGRAVTNPPPGMADIAKSLPTFSSVAPR